MSSEAAPATTPGLAAGGDVVKKLETAKGLKEKADKSFQEGKLKDALASYHQALLYLHGLDKNSLQKALGQPVPPPPPIEAVDQAAQEKPKTEVDILQEKIYSNMSQCHLANQNWKRAVETADKALALNPKNRKALFRKAKAQGELGYFEKAEKILEDLIKDAEPTEKDICQKELARLRAIDKERERAHNQKLKGFLNKEKVDLSAA
ncbi:hypothetical protein PYCCODRAFT_1431646 [Trametes coccinea BRFM310]|uniref:Uncharacterized protein n=1 Tax=Trametes coccinea (strain BRFM310) TaxID=1353009 RepID=A0A1Y2IZQ8_TRAC3|nr:hypothetical protein PYCCODRAFT_1431646 [Trametes coccinea BRFM310]